MSWQLWGIGIAILLLLFAIFKKVLTGKKYVGGKRLGSFSIKKRVIAFATPSRIELILISLYVGVFLWGDVVQNAVAAYGFNHNVEWFAGITTSAWSLYLILLFVHTCILMALFLFSLKQKKTNKFYDIIVGTIAFFGVALLLGGVFAQTQGFNVTVFGNNLSPTSFYHLGVFATIGAGLFWVLTD